MTTMPDFGLLAATHLDPGWSIVVVAGAVGLAIVLERRLGRATIPKRSARIRRWIVRVLGATGVLSGLGLAIVDPDAGTTAALLYLGLWSCVILLVLAAAALAVLDVVFWMTLHAAALRHLEDGTAPGHREEGP